MSAEQDQDQAFLKSFGIVMLILAVIAVSSFFGARIISAVGEPQGPHPEEMLLAQQRTDPVYRVVTDASALQKVAAGGGAAQTGPAKSGEEIFKAVCHTCHVPGLLGAPKVTDTAEWKKRLAEQGIDTLHENAINGIGQMPPKGGKASLSNDEVIAAVNYILATAGIETAAAATSADKAESGASTDETKPTGDDAAAADKNTTAAADGAAAETADAAATKTAAADEDKTAAAGDTTDKADKSADTSTAAATDTASSGEQAAAAGGAIDTQAANTIGKKVFETLCQTCHVPGIAGAPKVSDAAEWNKRLAAQGLDKLHYNAIHGLGAMPPKGGNAALSDDEVIAAVNYMLLQSGAK